MAQTQARYDEFAEWYEQWSCDIPAPLTVAQAGLLPAVAGDRVLDIACGQGRLSRYLASLGGQVTGVDISVAMLGKARATGPESITYIHGDVTRDLAWWDGRPFDGCTCEMVLMDIDDLAGPCPRWQRCCARVAGSSLRSCIRAFPAMSLAGAVGRQERVTRLRAGGLHRTTIPTASGSG